MKKLLSPAKKVLRAVCSKWPIVLLVAIVAVGAVTGFLLHKHNQKAIETKKKTVITYSPDKPDEKKPDKQTYKWYGFDNDPKYITIPSVKAEGFLQKVGVDQKKQVATPGNIFMAGWFVDTVHPGEKGLSIIDGHVNGIQNAGIFKNIGKLKAGDTYTVEFGSGDKKTFKVKDVQNVPVADAASVLFSQDPEITRQLNLITCGGTFNRQTRQYENRVIVISEAI